MDDARFNSAPSIVQEANSFQPGALGRIEQFYFGSAPRPAKDIALAGSIGFLAGITGSAYNVRGTGVNTYILVVAPTGSGKDSLSSACTKLMQSVSPSVPAIWDFRGPGDLVSYAGLYKAAIGRSSMHCVFNEFGKKMKEMANGKNPNLIGVQRIVLEAFSKSGFGEMILPSAYSDEKNRRLPPLSRFALTITAETTPAIYQDFHENLISDGLLPRFMVFNHAGERAYLNEDVDSAVPPPELVQEIANIAAHSLAVSTRKAVINVGASPEAALLFKQFDITTTDLIRGAKSEAQIQLWNRGHLKALKLGALRAIGINYLDPKISEADALWAIKLVEEQTKTLISKFDNNEVGEEGGNEAKQRNHILRITANYFAHEIEWGDDNLLLRQHGIIRQSYIQARVSKLPAFYDDKRKGANKAIKDILTSMYENGEIQAADVIKASEILGKPFKARAFHITEPKILEPYWPENSKFVSVFDFFKSVRR
jgi:hypothetical protein